MAAASHAPRGHNSSAHVARAAPDRAPTLSFITETGLKDWNRRCMRVRVALWIFLEYSKRQNVWNRYSKRARLIRSYGQELIKRQKVLNRPIRADWIKLGCWYHSYMFNAFQHAWVASPLVSIFFHMWYHFPIFYLFVETQRAVIYHYTVWFRTT